MVGASYGGGIQLTVAGIDCRVDALVPSLAWHSLETSLYKAETVKSGWATTLADVAAAGTLDPHVTSAAASGPSTGLLGADDLEWFRDRGPAELVDEVTAPTLFVHGTVDTLFRSVSDNQPPHRWHRVPTCICGLSPGPASPTSPTWPGHAPLPG